MPKPDAAPKLIGSTEALAILDIDRSTLSRWVAAGRLAPLGRVTANGAFVFAEEDVRALASEPRSPQYLSRHTGAPEAAASAGAA